jgi:tetratricopeptide (TPR) repeat protein
MDQDIKHHLTHGRDLYAAGEYGKAEPHLREVLAVHDGFADVHNMLGVILSQRGEYERARESLERAMAINPRYSEAAINLAVVYTELGMYDDAKRMHEIASRPSMRPAFGEEADAVSRLDGFVRGKLANLHREIADAYVGVGLLERAIHEYRQALELAPTFADIRTRLATALHDAGRVGEAIDELRDLRESNPEYLPAANHLGLAYWAAGRRDEAVAQWEAVLAADGSNRTAAVYLKMAKA